MTPTRLVRLAFFSKLSLPLLFFAMALGSASAQTSITGVRLGVHPNGVTRFVMDMSDKMGFRVNLLTDPYRIVIGSNDILWAVKTDLRKEEGSIAKVRFEKNGGHVVIELRHPAVIKTTLLLSPSEGVGWRFVLDLKDATHQAFLAAAGPNAGPHPPAPSISASAPSAVAAVSTPLPISAANVSTLSPAFAEAVSAPQSGPAGTAAELDEQVARALVQTAVVDIQKFFAGKTLRPDQAKAAVGILIAKYSDMSIEAQQILGRYWDKASPQQRTEFQVLLEGFLINFMVNGLPVDQRITITGADRKGDREVVVHSFCEDQRNEGKQVDWTVMAGVDGRPVITDFSSSGASMVTTLHSDFISVLRTAAADGISALFEPMRKKMAASTRVSTSNPDGVVDVAPEPGEREAAR